ncbi:FAD-dependent oxidoreductase [Streptomyces sp. NPDC048385]|uniref:FAD-binding oxidoreductase n=1 Tax=unclassified Streptomyces TaxID=2593676 RepID=UPI0034232113
MATRRAFLTSAGGLALAAVGATSAGPVASALSTTVGDDAWDRLAQSLAGDLVRPSDAGYPRARSVYLGEYSALRPQAVARCRTVADVRACLRFAREQSIELRTRSGGHNLAGWSTGEGLVVDVSAFRQVRTDGRTVHLGPGAMSIEALTALEPHGVQIVTGTCPTVCPGGFVSGGGIGHQTRKFGTASDRLVSARVMLADGRLAHVSETSEPDLFWALRGGGGGTFGVVLDFEVVPVDQPGGVFFDTEWPWDKAQEVIETWQHWSVAGPHDLGSALLVALPDAAPGATPTVLLSGTFWGDPRDLESGLDELAAQSGARPVRRESSELAYGDVMRRVYGCGQLTVDECHLTGQNPDAELPRNGVLRERTRIFDRAVTGSVLSDSLAAYDGGRQAGQTRFLSFTATGGRANEPGRADTAYWHRSAQFMTGFAAMTADAAPPAAVEAAMTDWVDRGSALLAPASTGEAYVNFPDPRLTDWRRAYFGDNYTRLLEVKRRYDPADVFHHAQSVGS